MAAGGHPALVTPTAEPAGSIATRTAGCVEFHATLVWSGAGDAPPGPTLPELTGPFSLSLAEEDDEATAIRKVYGEIRALTEPDLGRALDAVMRAVTARAAVTEAVLETSAVYRCRPGVAPAGALQALARDLWEAGFPVGFGVSWEPVPRPGVALGVRGAEDELGAFLRNHALWRLA